MPNVDEIKKELDKYYSELSGLKNISAEDSKKVVKKLNELLRCQDNASLVANELFRFPKSIFVRFFKDMKMTGSDIARVTNLFWSLSQSSKWKDNRQIAKLKDALIELYGKKCSINGIGLLTVTFLKNIWFNGKLSMNEKIIQLASFIHKTKGRVYEVDYLDCQKSELEIVRDITLRVYGDELTKSEYYHKIKGWFEKYDFSLSDTEQSTDNTEKPTVLPQAQNTVSLPTKEGVSSPAKESTSPQVAASKETAVQTDEETDYRRSADQVVADMTGAISEITQAVKRITDEDCRMLLESITALRNTITEGNRIHRENSELNIKVVRLETELVSKTNDLEKAEELLAAVRSELDESKERLVRQTEQIEYLSGLNSRENEQAVLSLKKNLSAPLRLCYEDWQEFSEAECTEDNYQSLLIILKKIFKTLEKNGIVFEG